MNRVGCRWAVMAIVALAAVARPADAANELTGRWALLVGIDDYAELEDLHCAGNDQRAFARQLVDCGFPEDQVFLLDDRAKEKKYLPFRENIERQLKLALALPRPDDLLIVGFSGHGVTLEGKRYLCPMEARLSEVSTLIAVDDIYRQLGQCRATLKLLFLDACRSGDPRPPGRRAAASLPGLNDFNAVKERPPAGLMILSSCGEGQSAMEDQEQLGQGVFMHFVLQGLQGKAANSEGLVTLASLYDYSSLATEKYVARRWNDFQTPALDGKIDGAFKIARAHVPAPILAPSEIGPPAGSVITNSIGMHLVRIPAGEFETGGTESAADLKAAGFDLGDLTVDDQQPKHRVQISAPFWLGMYEVTKTQFAEFVAATGYKTEPEKDPKGGFGVAADGKGFERGPALNWRNWGTSHIAQSPVVNVSWNDAAAYCQWLSKKEGNVYRLPTEAEWEYACRAGTTTRCYFGDDPEGLAQAGNVADASAKEQLKLDFGIKARDGYAFTCNVGQFRPNSFGLFDMYGNVSEWCSDWYDADYYAAATLADPKGPSAGKYRVMRGGGFDSRPLACTSACRDATEPNALGVTIGFRVLCEGVELPKLARLRNTTRTPPDDEFSPPSITNSIGMKLALVPAGEFAMGGDETTANLKAAGFGFDDLFGSENERPRHRVRITRPFYLGMYEVTLGEFLKFYHDAGYRCECEQDGKGGWGFNSDNGGKYEQQPKFVPWSWGHEDQTMEHPVVNVTWNDAVAFCNWLSRKEGKRYRLPTEAEREYACRAGSSTRFANGDDPEQLVLVGNVPDASRSKKASNWLIRADDGYALTAPVGQFKPNAFGIFDMHGNVNEWCSDWYNDNYYATSPEDDPAGPAKGKEQVVRGGSFSTSAAYCRSSFRTYMAPSHRYAILGFRVAHDRVIASSAPAPAAQALVPNAEK